MISKELKDDTGLKFRHLIISREELEKIEKYDWLTDNHISFYLLSRIHYYAKKSVEKFKVCFKLTPMTGVNQGKLTLLGSFSFISRFGTFCINA